MCGCHCYNTCDMWFTGSDHGEQVTREAYIVGLHGCAWGLRDKWYDTYVVVILMMGLTSSGHDTACFFTRKKKKGSACSTTTEQSHTW